jgi:hypothetical protein
MRLLLLVILSMLLLINCSARTTCPHFPRPSAEVKEILRPYQDKNEYPDTWAWFNDLYTLCVQLGDCNEEKAE